MKAEQARTMTDQALEELAAALRAGKSEELTRYLDTLSRFHHYSFGNVMLIMSQCPSATHVAGYNAWKSMGRWVKPGEKGIAIIAPMRLKKREHEEKDLAEGNIGDVGSFLRFKVVYVFDASQTDGKPMPEIRRVAGDPGDFTRRVKEFIQSRGIALTYEDLNGAEGLSSGGQIRVKSGLPPAEEFSVLVHELAHEMLHHGEGAKRGPKVVRETEAEAVAFVVTRAVGLAQTEAAVDYIQLYQGNVETLAQSLDRIQHTASSILEAIGQEPDEEQLAA